MHLSHLLSAALILGSAQSASATRVSPPTEPEARPAVDLVIALDVSGSMDGLIDSARQRLWDIVGELGQAQPTPDLRIALLSYGSPSYGVETGYVRIDQPFTRDLDAVSETLFAYTTSGGDEYVARVAQSALKNLQWSESSDALRLLYVAGNESAEQDPLVNLADVGSLANDMGVAINAIYCGPDGDSIAQTWQGVANLSQGMYASIDQNAAAVAQIETPFDAELSALNKELSSTYVAKRSGEAKHANAMAQDANASSMSTQAAASRAVAKSSKLYRADDWDLVDAVAGGQSLEDVAEEEMPQEMVAMKLEEREAYIQEKAQLRAELQSQVAELADQRQQFLVEERKKRAEEGMQGLDDALNLSLRTQAAAKGINLGSGG